MKKIGFFDFLLKKKDSIAVTASTPTEKELLKQKLDEIDEIREMANKSYKSFLL